MTELITWLERQIELCDDLKNMEKEKWAFIQTLKKVRKEAINYTRCCKSDSEQLKVLGEHIAEQFDHKAEDVIEQLEWKFKNL